MSGSTQISAFISEATREVLERYAQAHGVKKAHLVEEALLHHLKALNELPADVLVPPRIVVSAEAGSKLAERLEKPKRPTKAMRALFGK